MADYPWKQAQKGKRGSGAARSIVCRRL